MNYPELCMHKSSFSGMNGKMKEFYLFRIFSNEADIEKKASFPQMWANNQKKHPP